MQNVEEINSEDYTSLWQESMPDIAWGTIFLAISIAVGYYLTITSALEGSIHYAAASLICGYLSFASFTVLHDAGHGGIVRMGSPLKPIEDILGWAYSLPLCLIPYRFFQKIHDRHHAFTNDPERDPDHFILGSKWYQVLPNIFLIPFQYHYMSVTSLRHIKIFRDTYISSIAYFALVFGTLIILASSGYATEVLCFVIAPLAMSVFLLVMFFDYIPHHPHKCLDRYQNTRIFSGKVWNVIMLGQNYHLIHHMYPRLPWYKYQQVFHKILPVLEAKGAPIENVVFGPRPDLMASPNAHNLPGNGQSINMLLTVNNIEKLTSDSVSVSFELPAGQKLQYKAGQYITVSKWLASEQQTRCYSLCASPDEGLLKVGVRHTPDGLVSAYINQVLDVGDELIVQGPFGDFVYPPMHEETIKELVLVAGGSGITPMLSILETALQENNNTPIHLLYAGRSAASIMFYQHIQSLVTANTGQLKVSYIIEEQEQDIGISGRLNRETMEALLPMIGANAEIENISATEFYICGPEGFKNSVVNTLEANMIPSGHVHIEQFVSTVTEPIGEQYAIDIGLADGQKHALKVASNQTVLEVAKAEGVMLPHACGNGTCGTCKFKVDQGPSETIPNSIPGITADEQAVGFTLACQCKPLGDMAISEIRN